MSTLIDEFTTSRNGIGTVAGHEFRLRLRTGRWRWILGSWFGLLLLFTAALRQALSADRDLPLGTPMFGGLMLFQLGLALLVVPALTAQSINGDRENGVLATLQITMLRPVDIAVGKLAAAWGCALIFLALSLPLVGWTMLEGGVELVRVVVTLLVVALLLGVICAIAQCLSAVIARSTTSAVLSYLVVFTLTVGTLITFALASAIDRERVSAPGCPAVPNTATVEPCMADTAMQRSDRVWWLLAPNPFVILADAAPRAVPARDRNGDEVRRPLDPLGEIGTEVRRLRRPPFPFRIDSNDDAPPVWPYGLAFDLLLGGAALAITIRRLRTPTGRLPRGTRIA